MKITTIIRVKGQKSNTRVTKEQDKRWWWCSSNNDIVITRKDVTLGKRKKAKEKDK